MAHCSNLNCLLLTPSHSAQRISFSVRVRSSALPNSTDNMGLPWVHVDLLPSQQLENAIDYRFRPYSVASGPSWRYKSDLNLDSFHCDPGESDCFEDVYFPIDIPGIACLDLIGCLYCITSITAGYAPEAAMAIVNSQADDDFNLEEDHLHKRVTNFTNWEPIWTIKVSDHGHFESLSASSGSKFTKTSLYPEGSQTVGGKKMRRKQNCINVIRFEMSSTRKPSSIEPLIPKLFDPTPVPPTTNGGRKSRANRHSTFASNVLANVHNTSPNTKLNNNNGNVVVRKRMSNNSQQAEFSSINSNSNPKATLSNLPPELILHIVNFIAGGAFERLRLLTVLSGVNRRLRSICSIPSLYRTVDLKQAAHCSAKLTPQFFNFLAARSSHSVETLRLSWLPSLALKTFKLDMLITPHCNLKVVILQSCPLVDDTFLKVLCRAASHSLETIDLSSCWSISRRGFGCLDQLTNLKHLSLAHTLISQRTLDMLLEALGKTLTVLNIASLHDISNMDGVCLKLAKHCQGIRSLDLSDSPHLSQVGITTLANNCSSIEELVLLSCGLVPSIMCIQKAADSWPKLRRLFLPISDTSTLNIFAGERNKLPKLEQLFISNFRRSGAPISTLRDLLIAFPNLTYLKVPIEWPSASDFEESRIQLANLRRNYPNCVIQAQ